MKTLIALGFLVSAASCTSPGCLLQEKGVDVIVPVIVGTLQCQNGAAVTRSINALVAPLGLCSAQTGSISGFICAPAAKVVVDFIAKNAIPAEWGCNPINAKAATITALTSACMALPVEK